MSKLPIIIALGQEFRSDDGVGPWALQQAQILFKQKCSYQHHRGDPTDLIDLWQGRDALVLDAVVMDQQREDPSHTGVHVLRPLEGDGTLKMKRSTSSHAFGLIEAVELGKILGKLPQSLTIVAVEACDFGQGVHISAKVRSSLPHILAAIEQWLAQLPPSHHTRSHHA